MSSPLVDQVRAVMTAARKNRDSDRTLLYSTLLSEFGNQEIALGHALSDAEALDVVRRGIKRRRESVEDLGELMGKVMPAFKGRADGKLINQIAREGLAG